MLPSGFHRIRHYGLLANANRQRDIPAVRALLHQPASPAARGPKRRTHRRAAHLRMPALRRADAHHRDLPSSAIHPRTADLSEVAMSTPCSTPQSSSSAHHRSRADANARGHRPPVPNVLAYGGASPISGSDRIGFTPRGRRGPRIGSAITLAGPSVFVQIAIAHRNR